jgi:hypothetical protein
MRENETQMAPILKIRVWLCFCSAIALSSCYEGWDDSDYQQGQGLETPAPPVPEIKPLAYVLFQPIVMTAAALQDDSCYPFVGFRAYRQAEWSERILAINDVLASLAEETVYQPIEIGPDDCQGLTSVQVYAATQAPWGAAQNAPALDSLSRPVIHLKAAFWDTEPPAIPSASVLAEDWISWQILQSQGHNAYSRHYNAVSRVDDGYFSLWFAAQSAESLLRATVQDTVDPTPEGITARQQLALSDAQALGVWLIGQ